LFLKAKLLLRRAEDILVIDLIDKQLVGTFVNGVDDGTLQIVLDVGSVYFRLSQLADTVFKTKFCQFVYLIHQLLQGTLTGNLDTIGDDGGTDARLTPSNNCQIECRT
jgi:hypothetical protein